MEPHVLRFFCGSAGHCPQLGPVDMPAGECTREQRQTLERTRDRDTIAHLALAKPKALA